MSLRPKLLRLRAKALDAKASGSLRWDLTKVRSWLRACSNSACENVGARKTSRSKGMSAGRLARTVSNCSTRLCPCWVTDSLVLSRSSVLLISLRLRFPAPRVSKLATISMALARPASDFSSPISSTIWPETVWPRVFFGISTNRAPPGSVVRKVRSSIITGVSAKASPWVTAGLPW